MTGVLTRTGYDRIVQESDRVVLRLDLAEEV